MEQSEAKKSFLKEVLLQYTYMGLWIGLSAAVILFNKYILSTDFVYPITLTMIHMAFCSLLAAALISLGLVGSVNMPLQTYLRCVVPIAALFSLVLWFGNAAYLFLSVSFIQMLKASMPVAVYTVGNVFGTESYSLSKTANMLVITFGVAVASYGEINFHVLGFVYQMASIASESTRLTLIQILLQRQGIKLNPVTTLYYIAPACLGFLCIPFVFLELKTVTANLAIFNWPLLLMNAAAAFALNMSVFLLIGKTSALTMNIAGVIKDWLLIYLSYVLFRAPLSALQLGGYFIAFLGVGYFNYKKIAAMRQAADASSQAGSIDPAAKSSKLMAEEKVPLTSLKDNKV